MSELTVEKLIDAMKEVFPTAEMVQHGFAEVDKRFEQINKRFDRIENLILSDHKKRIEHLEHELKEIKNALAI